MEREDGRRAGAGSCMVLRMKLEDIRELPPRASARAWHAFVKRESQSTIAGISQRRPRILIYEGIARPRKERHCRYRHGLWDVGRLVFFRKTDGRFGLGASDRQSV